VRRTDAKSEDVETEIAAHRSEQHHRFRPELSRQCPAIARISRGRRNPALCFSVDPR
jgi:hypothetical protein